MTPLTDSHMQTYNFEQKSPVTPFPSTSFYPFSLGGISVMVFISDVDLFGE